MRSSGRVGLRRHLAETHVVEDEEIDAAEATLAGLGFITIDANIGQYYHEYVGSYIGSYGEGSPYNRFFPTLGNHDWRTHALAPYLDYFVLPGNERYYMLSWGPVDLFMLDSDQAEPDGVDVGSVQARWLEAELAASKAPWKLVLLHHAPYSSGMHGSTQALQWPYATWGADAVIAGHDHLYERIERDGVVYLVNGLGGHGKRYQFTTPVSGSELRFNEMHGAMRVQATAQELRFEFVRVDGQVVDSRVLTSTQRLEIDERSVTRISATPRR